MLLAVERQRLGPAPDDDIIAAAIDRAAVGFMAELVANGLVFCEQIKEAVHACVERGSSGKHGRETIINGDDELMNK